MRAMKDSGIEWIGKIPQEWNVSPLKSKYSFGKGLSITKADLSDEGAKVISYGQIHSKDNVGVAVLDSLIRHLPWDHNSLSDTAKTSVGDLIFADTSEDLEGCGNCVYIDRDDPIYAGYHTLILRPKASKLGKYYAYLFSSDAWRTQVRTSVNGVKVFSITQDILKKTVLLEPSEKEQERIVKYLDKKCAEIDALIAAKEKTNALLKEQRQSLIFEAVTKGLDPTVPMKDSGLSWIDMIPKTWHVIPLSKISERMNNGYVGPTRNIFVDDGVRYLQSLHIKDGKILFDKAPYYVSHEWALEHSLGTVHTGDVLIVQTGDIGQVAHVTEDYNGCNCHALIIVTPRGKLCKGEYLSYLLQSHYGRNQLLSCRTGALHPHLNSGNIRSIKLPIPPTIDEQSEIVSYLDSECEKLDKIIADNDSTIQMLKEYRQSLIYEAVTGKIEVSK